MTATLFRVFATIDFKSVKRDPLLRLFLLVPVFMGLGVRVLLPQLAPLAQDWFGVDMAAYYPLWMSMIALAVPMIAGGLVGFLLLDNRDDGVLQALRVTPLSLNGYFLYRSLAPLGLGVLSTLLVIPLAGLAPLSFPAALLVALAGAPFGTLTALYLAAFAENKVQGLALLKISGVLLLPPLAAYFLPANWQVLFWLAPSYWPMKVYWLLAAGAGGAPVWALVGFLYQFALCAWLLARFKKRLSR